MRIKAYAKINLGLHVLEKRPDNFHNIETIFHRINLFDSLTIEPHGNAISISGAGEPMPLDERNLCWKAVELLRAETGTKQGASIHIEKKIPIGAGLGGGSSDAAATLRMLPSIWQTTIDPSTLARVALGIGSDVPFFLHHRSAYAEGRGEKLSFVNLTLPYWIVVVTPRIHVSTAWAYSQLTSSRRNGLHAEKFYDDTTCTVAGIAALMKNDFEEVVLAKYPDIGHLKQGLLDCGASYALLSGSGSSVFGLFEDEHRALKARERFVAAHTVSLTPPNFIPEL